MNRDIVLLFLKALEYRGQDLKLIKFTLQALDRFFAWDKHNTGGRVEQSVIAYFEGGGGYSLLDSLSTNV